MSMRRRLGLAVATGVCLAAAAGAGSALADVGGNEQLFLITDPHITESSGLATSHTLPGVLWTVNDSGGTPQVFGIGPRGSTVARLTLSGASNRDWEAVAVGPAAGGGSWLWVGDIGDNLSQWASIRVYRVAEPTERGDRTVGWTAYDLVYPDGPRNAEALLVDPSDGRLYVVSKRVQGAAVYRAPQVLRSDRVNRLVKVGSAPPLVTDGAFAPDGRVAIRDYLQAWVSPGAVGHRDRVALPLQPQGESLTWTSDGAALLVGSEGADSAVWRVAVGASAGEPTASSPAPTGNAGSSPPEAATSVEQPPASSATSAGTAVWWVAGAGLVLGAVLGLLVRRRRGAARVPSADAAGTDEPG